MAVMFTITNLAYSIPFSILVLFARDRLALDAVGYGVLLSVSAVGGLLGSWLAARLRRRLGFSVTICSSLLLGAASYLAIAATENATVAGAALAAYIFSTVVWNITAASTGQRLVPDHLRGRISSVNRLCGLTGLTVGYLLGGTLAAAVGLTAPFWLAGVLLAATAAAFLPITRRWERSRPPAVATGTGGRDEAGR